MVCIPFGLAESLLPTVEAKRWEILRDIRSGKGWNRNWIDETHKELGCEF
ncbi:MULTISPECIES: hypothetical protein [unclassified Bradyrhizobium]|nr:MULTISPECIES: hypothetical protein [unclassified Bradyrhizobium]MDH2346214.1 hypothetical protein [Bradyrhizobium sp. SSUT77]MDH2350413.1 hypothetical protein [Bradyrhizobium sp. SSUT112]